VRALLQAPEGLTVLQLEKDLRSRVDLLNKEKQDRLRQMKQRTKVDQQLCDALGAVPYFISPNCVPSEQQLSELEEHICSLETEKVIFYQKQPDLLKISSLKYP
jgi:Ase1/PRC1/MAP65 family protein